MTAAITMNNLAMLDSVEQPMGGMQRELINIGLILAERYDTKLYLPTTKPFTYNNLIFTNTLNCYDYVDIGVNYPIHCRKNIVYDFSDRGQFNTKFDLVITDTKRGKEKYEKDGYRSLVFFPIIPIGGNDSIRERKKILSVGAINVGKRTDLAISAINLLPEYELHIIGMERGKSAGWQGIYVEDYYAYCKSISGSNVIWRGALPYSEVISEMQSSEMIIIPYCSDEEFNTDVALEAISNGCVPLIANGLTDYLEEAEAVFLPNQKYLSPSIIVNAIKSISDDELKFRRNRCYNKANEIYKYCTTEMKDIICEI